MTYQSPKSTSFDFYLRYSPYIPPAVQAHYVAHPHYRRTMLANPDLDQSLLASLITSRPSNDSSSLLASRKLTPSLQKLFLTHESRFYPLIDFLKANLPVTRPALLRLLANLANPALLPPLYSWLRPDPILADFLGPHLAPMDRLVWLTDQAHSSLCDLSATLTDLTSTTKKPNVRRRLTLLFDLHPEALSLALALNHPAMDLAAASSINLTSSQAVHLLGFDRLSISYDDIRTLALSPTVAPLAPAPLVRALLANPVLPSRISLYLSRLDSLDPALRALSRRRYHSAIPSLNPGFEDLSTEGFNYLFESIRTAVHYRRNPMGYSSLGWVPAMMKNAPASPNPDLQSSVLHRLLSHTSCVNLFGPIRYHSLVTELKSRWNMSPLFVYTPDLVDLAKSNPRYSKIALPERITAADIKMVLSFPASKCPTTQPMNATTAPLFVHVAGPYLQSKLQDSLTRWQLFEDLAAHSADTSLEDVVTIITRLVP